MKNKTRYPVINAIDMKEKLEFENLLYAFSFIDEDEDNLTLFNSFYPFSFYLKWIFWWKTSTEFKKNITSKLYTWYIYIYQRNFLWYDKRKIKNDVLLQTMIHV